MVFKWRDDHTLLVLELLQNEECLWNTKLENYRKRSCRDSALENIVKHLSLPDVTPNDVKLKIKSIRSRYASELAKVLKSEKSGAGRDDIYMPKLFWFKQADLFLRPFCTPRLSSSMKVTPQNDDDDEEEHETITKIEHFSEEDAHELSETEANDLTAAVVNPLRSIYMREYRTGKEQSNNRICRRRQLKPASEFPNINNAVRKLRKLSQDCKDREDEFDLFGRTLAAQLRSMPLHRALLCQQKLHQVIIEERLNQIGTDHRHRCS